MSTSNPYGGVSRRSFLGLVAASLATAGPGCRRALRERIVPYVHRPESVRPGQVTTYATSMVLDGYATGLLVDCVEGRPIKIEGNPAHPASLGAAGPIEQASVLDLYDPDRAAGTTFRGRPASWHGLRRVLADLRQSGGEGLRILMPPTSSVFLADLIARVEQALPAARFIFHSSVATSDGWAGSVFAKGRPRLELVHDFAAAKTVVSLDADFLGRGPFWLRYARQWAERRDPETEMSRLYCAETAMSVTGSMADERLAVPPSEVAKLALNLAATVLGAASATRVAPALAGLLEKSRNPDPWVAAAARDLARAAGNGAVVVGHRQPAAVQALGLLLNQRLGNLGKTVTTLPCGLAQAKAPMSLPALADEIGKGQVKAVIVLGGNPAYDAPADLDLARLPDAVPLSIHLGLYRNETGRVCHWHVPAAHYLESWADARALDGTLSFAQPLIAGLHEGHDPAGVLLALLGDPLENPGDALREFWRARHGTHGFGDTWQSWLRQGLAEGSAFAAADATIDEETLATEVGRLPSPSGNGLEVNLLPDPAIHDGSFANNAWLAELPRPISRLTWGNAALISAATAASLHAETGQVLDLRLEDRTLRAPVLVTAGHADRSVTLYLGHGRSGTERTGRHVGVDAGRLRTNAMPWFGSGLEADVTGDHQPLALFQLEDQMHDRAIALRTSQAQYRSQPDRFARHRGPQGSLLPPYHYVGTQWAMSIDLGLCIGCQACVVACQAENNVPVVGAREVSRGRLMHWLRVDSYISGAKDMTVIHQPLPCQHCETAPCEYVCPVNATVHSPDGLNEMVYNRCVGTRFCSNNCPYKVRRFNWFNWHDHEPANQGSVRMQRNPDVTVRDRGVMEKCTYCVQRIRRAEFAARIENREIRPGEVMTACQQACPTGAIAFASLGHTELPAVKRRKSRRAYQLLHEQGTRPRTWYLARIDNPNPERG